MANQQYTSENIKTEYVKNVKNIKNDILMRYNMKKCIIVVDNDNICTITFPDGEIAVRNSRHTAYSACVDWEKRLPVADRIKVEWQFE